MIKFLRIKNLATIEDVEIRFQDGLSILTGETGAGKSIIIEAVKLILGEKASSDYIRSGEKGASIEAAFDAPAAFQDIPDLPASGDGDLLVHRQISEEGTGKAYLNGVLVPLKKLKETGPAIVDIYGQNDHVFLLNLENHLRYLDAFVEAPAPKQAVAAAARGLKDAVRQKSDLLERRQQREQRLDFIRYQIQEIEAARLRPGEDEELLEERHVLRNSEKISELVRRALEICYQEEDSLLPRLAKLEAALVELSEFTSAFADSKGLISEFEISLKELSDGLIRFQDRRAAATGNLEAVEERLDALDKLKRKYGARVEDILSFLEKIKDEEKGLAAGEERLADLDAEIQRKFKEYSSAAAELSERRGRGAAQIRKLVEKELALLGMKSAKFSVRISTVPPSPGDIRTVRESGSEDAEFLISPNPGEELKPLRKIASGGELSRVMLALKSIGKESESAKTLIFDEIDSGIGGRTAECIAQKLQGLSKAHQVICVTHLPQIASCAAHHYHIDKKVENARTFTTVKKLKPEERAAEIARLISGSRLTEASLKIAKEMLEHNAKSGG